MGERTKHELKSVEVCAGAGGQALGLEEAGFDHVALVELDRHACETLRMNRPNWNVLECDLRAVEGTDQWLGIDLLAGGVPCPPFSVAGKRLGVDDERNLFEEMLDLAAKIEPRAVLIENVPGLMEARFASYRDHVRTTLEGQGFTVFWDKLNASDYGVPQLRPRTFLVALRGRAADRFEWPERQHAPPPTVGETLHKLMAGRDWEGADAWRERANAIAPTLVGGSHKHGGPDLGPTRAKRAWAALSVDGLGLADHAPEPGFVKMPRLTVEMCARLQGFPDDWTFFGRKTQSYRQVGNALPPPVAQAVGSAVSAALTGQRAGEAA